MKRIFNYFLIVSLSALLFACSEDNNQPSQKPIYQPDERVFILNEGSFGKTRGSLQVITNTRAYLTGVDNGVLGTSAQDLAFLGNQFFVVSQDPNGMTGRLVSFDTKTCTPRKDYSKVIESLQKPTHLSAISMNNIYIRDAKGIHHVDLLQGKVTFVEGTERANQYAMQKVGTQIFAGVGNKLVVLGNNTTKVEKSLELTGKIQGIVYDGKQNLYVATAAKQKTTIYQVSPSALSIVSENSIEGEAGGVTGNSYWGQAPVIAAKGDTIYFAGGSSKIYRHLFSKKETKEMVDTTAKGFYPVGTITYNSVGVHPTTGHVYISRLKGFGPDSYTNAILELDLSQDEPKLVKLYENKLEFPAGFFFPKNAR